VLHTLFLTNSGVPASSAPAERIISQSGLMMHPNRAKMADEVLEQLMFILTNDICNA